MELKRITKKIKRSLNFSRPLVLVYSHPRSGTHLLEAFLAENFYRGKDLKIEKITWGHWSNRKINSEGNKYGRLFGNHNFPNKNQNNLPKIYIYRDGRAVAYSIWKTENFLHKNLKDVSFDDFLNKKIDWYGSPANKSEENRTIFEHWAEHFSSWKIFAQRENILLIKYEDLIERPGEQYIKIQKQFFRHKKIKKNQEIRIIKEPIGLLPNKAVINSWNEKISKKNLDYFGEILNRYTIDEYE